MNHVKSLAIGAYVAVTAYFFDMIWALIFTLLGRPVSYVGPLLLAITTAYFVADFLFNRWRAPKNRKLWVIGVVFVSVVVLGMAAVRLTVLLWSMNR